MELFQEVFQALPLAAVVAGRVFVTHGGLFTKDGVTLQDIVQINRFREPPEGGGLMSDLMWSDPQPFPGREPSKRGVGMSFGPDVTERFLNANGLDILVRSHEVKEEGYAVEHGGRCITVFSAPNYCDQVGNKGAVCRLQKGSLGKPTFLVFSEVPHPPIRPVRFANPNARAPDAARNTHTPRPPLPPLHRTPRRWRTARVLRRCLACSV
jgi:serine/threonine-protein phosphatase 5